MTKPETKHQKVFVGEVQAEFPQLSYIYSRFMVESSRSHKFSYVGQDQILEAFIHSF